MQDRKHAGVATIHTNSSGHSNGISLLSTLIFRNSARYRPITITLYSSLMNYFYHFQHSQRRSERDEHVDERVDELVALVEELLVDQPRHRHVPDGPLQLVGERALLELLQVQPRRVGARDEHVDHGAVAAVEDLAPEPG